MIVFSLMNEVSKGKCHSWKIISSKPNYSLTDDDLAFDSDEEAELVKESKLEVKNFIYMLIPSDKGYHVQINDQNSNQCFISNRSFSMSEACEFILSLDSLKLSAIQRVWETKGLGKGIEIINNDINIVFRVDNSS